MTYSILKLPGRTTVIRGSRGPMGTGGITLQEAVDASLAAIRNGVDPSLDDLNKIAQALAAETQARIDADALKADKAVTITAAGLASGGGDLSANRTITVAEASTPEAQAGTSGTVVLTPRRGTDLLNAQKGVANGIASLDGAGKIPSAQLPPLAITSTFVVGSQAAMLALSAEEGDVAVRTDQGKTYILQTTPASVLANWVWMQTPTDLVLSVNGYTGAVALTYADVGAQQADSDLSQLAAIVHSAGDIIQDVAGVWTNRTLTQILAGGATLGGALQVNSTIDSSGIITSQSAVAGTSGWFQSSVVLGSLTGGDTTLVRDGAADTLAMRRGANAQAFRLYNLYNSGTDYERGVLDWTTNPGTLTLAALATGSGTQRGLIVQGATVSLYSGSNLRWTVNSAGNFLAGVDNSYDIGGSAANRPRNVNVGSNVVAGGFVQTGTSLKFGTLDDMILVRDAANILALRNGTTIQNLMVYKTWSDSANYERGRVGWANSTDFIVGNEALGTGSLANMQLHLKGGQQSRMYIAGSLVSAWDTVAYYPATANTFDIGKANQGWRNGYFDNSIRIGGVAPTGAAGVANIQSFGQNFALIGGNVLTDATDKATRIGGLHYLAAEEPIALIYSNGTVSGNTVNFGGGTSAANAATQLNFYTAANNATVTGTLRLAIDSAGHVNAGSDNAYDLGVSGARFRDVNLGGKVTAGGDLIAGGTADIQLSGRFRMRSSGDGILNLFNTGATAFTRLTLGAATAANAALAVVAGPGIQVQLADGSGRAALEASTLGLTSDLTVGASGKITWSGRAELRSTSSAAILLQNSGATAGATLEIQSMVAPSAPAAGRARIFLQDNGAGKMQLMALFPTGAAQQLALEP